MERAILREKQIKGGSRAAKLALIEGYNPDQRDPYKAIARWRHVLWIASLRSQ